MFLLRIFVPRLSIFQSRRFYREWHFVYSHPPFVLIHLIFVDISDLWKFHLQHRERIYQYVRSLTKNLEWNIRVEDAKARQRHF